ncbi:HAMP domain-containing protein [Lacisediminimonas profundi]|uniref:HAMP domain-containing protein n=1 Tax=Lacisediminimonas profundi TaxID=2603856 RepID=UPI00124B6FE8|nr:HAMP domain-containing protein [Lacisediminimonas profundi]
MDQVLASTVAPSGEELDLQQLLATLRAYRNGDFSVRMPDDLTGLAGKISDTVNEIIIMASGTVTEFDRVARLAGKQGRVNERIELPAMRGDWEKLVESTNSVVSDLVTPMNEMIHVIAAVADGDLSQQVPMEIDGLRLKGQFQRSAEIVNTMVLRLGSFTSEVTRVAREVGTEGMLGGQAQVSGLSGTWRDLTDSVNGMAANLTRQMRNIAYVTTAVANGDLTKKITVEANGEIRELKNTINTMVDQLSSFSAEVTRVAREVGTDGKLGGQAEVAGVSGTWRDLTESVNGMAANLTTQMRNIAEVTIAVANGNLSRKITVDVRGEFAQLKETINTMVDQLRSFAAEVTRVAREVGIEGKLGGQAFVPGVAGTWADLTDSVNMMASNLTDQVRNIAQVTTAVAHGDLGRKVTVDVKGEILELKSTVNRMVDQLNSFAAEVTRVAREVGTEGKLGGQAVVTGVSGTWKDLTDNVNFMAANLTNQVRGIARVVTAVAKGDLKKKLTVEAKGEIAELADTINEMTDTLADFADQVSSVAREVGVEGKLGGQAHVPGAAGTWKDLIGNVNGLAANLTNQVRAIAEVATAVTKGDLTRNVQVGARGEVAQLKDNVNEMIRNLRETTRQNADQDWLKSNLARFTRLLQGQRDLSAVSKMVLSGVAPLINAHHGLFYIMDETQYDNPRLKLLSAYAYSQQAQAEWRIGEGLVGQCAYDKRRLLLTNVPGDYVPICSGLGYAKPLNIIVLPILFENRVKAVIEMASFSLYSRIHETFLDQLAESIGIVLNTIEANMRTEELLKQSQSLAQELQMQQEELRQTNEELEDKAALLEEQKAEVEHKNREVEITKLSLEEKAEQLMLTSKYKSEFLSSMSHELRTPLNSLLILAQQLSDNLEKNLTPRQVDYARTIQGSGRDLLGLINEILDLSKIESGTVTLDFDDVLFDDVHNQMERTFRPLADRHALALHIELSPSLPRTITTDEKRLLQVLKNLLSNAFKFTERGGVTLMIEPAQSGWSVDHDNLNNADSVISFAVTDTGIGVAPDKQKLIFEAFQQADTGTSRKYGGTGLGLSISRELARLLGGELRLLRSKPGGGSTFTLFVPLRCNQNMIDTMSDQYGQQVESRPPLLRRVVPAPAEHVQDDRNDLQPGQPLVMIIENDARFASVLLKAARDSGMQGVVATRGGDALPMVEVYRPTTITLDLHLPDIDGWSLLERFKRDPLLRHIPVQIVSVEFDPLRSRRSGAFGHLLKPGTPEVLQQAIGSAVSFALRKQKYLLLLCGDDERRAGITALLANRDVRLKACANARDAIAASRRKRFDCVVIDRKYSEECGIALLDSLQGGKSAGSPVVLYGDPERGRQLPDPVRVLIDDALVRQARSPERLMDETTLFLHRQVDHLPQPQRKLIDSLYEGATSVEGHKVLIVDDDVRNIFALVSVLEHHKMEVVTAETGREAIALLHEEPGIELVLMDIMMPEMDGYETMQRIRRVPEFEELPIIALTAKAMTGDREKCIEAGASDYVSKPVDTDQLLAMIRVWLYR